MNSRTTVLRVGGSPGSMTSAAIVEQTLRRRPGVRAGVANAVAQTATVTYDVDRTDVARRLCGVGPRLRLPLCRAVGT